jgi:hypothetical protein
MATMGQTQWEPNAAQLLIYQYLYWTNQNVFRLNYPLTWGDTPETPEEAAKRKAAAVVAYEAERERKASAKVRAERLLFTILTPAQVKTYSDDGFFEQEINGRVYRLHANSYSQNVALMENGKAKIKYCAHPSDAYDTPIPDALMSQLLMLRANEQEFLRIANRTVLQ